MSTTTLLAAGAFACVSALVYGSVGRRLQRRHVYGEATLAKDLFSVWWYGLACVTAMGGLFSLGAAFFAPNFVLILGLTYVAILVLCVALWALAYYLLYLFTGRRGLLMPLAGLYLVYFAYLAFFIAAASPDRLEVGKWTVQLHYTQEFSGSAGGALSVLILGPLLIGALAYFRLFFKVEGATQRYRIALVALSFMVWFGSSIVASVGGISTNDVWQLASRVIALAASLVILLAYLPPAWVKQRYGVRSVDEDEAAASAHPAGPALGWGWRPDGPFAGKGLMAWASSISSGGSPRPRARTSAARASPNARGNWSSLARSGTGCPGNAGTSVGTSSAARAPGPRPRRSRARRARRTRRRTPPPSCAPPCRAAPR